jgi:type IV pilus assembly protein PilN
MIRTNLSTRPFYNEGAVQVWLALLAIVVGVATVFNVTRLIQYSRSDTELATQASRDEERTADLKTQAAQLRASVDAKQIEVASLEARLANDLIDRRTFSWTELFNIFESTLPGDVRITSIRPRIEEDRRIMLTISVLARSVEDIETFMQDLQETEAFTNLLPSNDMVNDQDQIEAVLEAQYLPGKGKKP